MSRLRDMVISCTAWHSSVRFGQRVATLEINDRKLNQGLNLFTTQPLRVLCHKTQSRTLQKPNTTHVRPNINFNSTPLDQLAGNSMLLGWGGEGRGDVCAHTILNINRLKQRKCGKRPPWEQGDKNIATLLTSPSN